MDPQWTWRSRWRSQIKQMDPPPVAVAFSRLLAVRSAILIKFIATPTITNEHQETLLDIKNPTVAPLDIKASNILLTADFEPKVLQMGLKKSYKKMSSVYLKLPLVMRKMMTLSLKTVVN